MEINQEADLGCSACFASGDGRNCKNQPNIFPLHYCVVSRVVKSPSPIAELVFCTEWLVPASIEYKSANLGKSASLLLPGPNCNKFRCAVSSDANTWTPPMNPSLLELRARSCSVHQRDYTWFIGGLSSCHSLQLILSEASLCSHPSHLPSPPNTLRICQVRESLA